MVVMGPPLPVKIPSPPIVRIPEKATVPAALMEGRPVRAKKVLVSAMVVMGPPLPVKMPRGPASKPAKKVTVPAALMEGLPKPSNSPAVS